MNDGILDDGILDVGQLDVAHELQQEQVPPLPLALALRPEQYMEHRPQLVFHKELALELRAGHQHLLGKGLPQVLEHELRKEHPLVLQLEQGKEYERHKEQGHKQEPPPVRILPQVPHKVLALREEHQ